MRIVFLHPRSVFQVVQVVEVVVVTLQVERLLQRRRHRRHRGRYRLVLAFGLALRRGFARWPRAAARAGPVVVRARVLRVRVPLVLLAVSLGPGGAGGKIKIRGDGRVRGARL